LRNNSRIKNIRDLYRGIINLKKGYQPRTDIAKDEKGDFVSDSHSISSRWTKYFSRIFIEHGVSVVRQRDIHSGPLVPEPSALEVELAIEKLKRRKLPVIGQIPAELIKTGSRTILRWIFRKWDVGVWTGLIWLRIGTGGGLL